MAAVLKRGELPTSNGLSLAKRAYREGRNAGIQEGALRYFSSRVTEDMALELMVLRAANEAMAETIRKQAALLDSVNRIKTDALKRCVELRRELDKR